MGLRIGRGALALGQGLGQLLMMKRQQELQNRQFEREDERFNLQREDMLADRDQEAQLKAAELQTKGFVPTGAARAIGSTLGAGVGSMLSPTVNVGGQDLTYAPQPKKNAFEYMGREFASAEEVAAAKRLIDPPAPRQAPNIGLGTPDWGEYIRRLGQVQSVTDNAPKPSAPTAAQEKMAVLVPRAEASMSDLESFLTERDFRVPEESFLGKVLPGQYLTSPDVQRYNQAGDVIVNAILRGESGATITEDEIASYRKQFIPTPGDKPETVKQKLRTLRTTLAQMKGATGNAIDRATVKYPENPYR
jgi:hypothetical protein